MGSSLRKPRNEGYEKLRYVACHLQHVLSSSAFISKSLCVLDGKRERERAYVLFPLLTNQSVSRSYHWSFVNLT